MHVGARLCAFVCVCVRLCAFVRARAWNRALHAAACHGLFMFAYVQGILSEEGDEDEGLFARGSGVCRLPPGWSARGGGQLCGAFEGCQ